MNVLAGALESAPATRDTELAFPETVEETAAVLNRAQAEGRPALVAWSFYSPQFEAATAELAPVPLHPVNRRRGQWA